MLLKVDRLKPVVLNPGMENKVYGLKEDEKYCYVHRQYKNPSFTYSMQAIELIFLEISKDPGNIVEHLKASVKGQKNSQPQGQRILGVTAYSHPGTQPCSFTS